MTTHGESDVSRFVLLLSIDTLLAFVANVCARFLRFGSESSEFLLQNQQVLAEIAVVTVTLVLSSYVFDVYKMSIHQNKRWIASNILIAAFCAFVLLSVIYYVLPILSLGRGVLALTMWIFMALQYLWHTGFSGVLSSILSKDKVIVVETGELARKIGTLIQDPAMQLSYVFAGYVETTRSKEEIKVPGHQILCSVDELPAQIDAFSITHIVVAAENSHNSPLLQKQLLRCKLKGVTIFDARTFYEMQTGKLFLEHMDLDWLIYCDGFKQNRIIEFLKRQMDIALALFGLVVTVPFYPLIALLVKLNAPGPIFYSQVRVGQWGKIFSLYKFRTMPQAAEQESGAVWSQQNDPRIRPIGGILRKCRIDELPQLYNVLKGEMSFVGPRPERPEFVTELERVIPLYSKRNYIKPGLTGWAQVSYPYGSSVEDSYEKLRYDLYYFKNMTPIFDTIIFAKTIKVVLCGSGGR